MICFKRFSIYSTAFALIGPCCLSGTYLLNRRWNQAGTMQPSIPRCHLRHFLHGGLPAYTYMPHAVRGLAASKASRSRSILLRRHLCYKNPNLTVCYLPSFLFQNIMWLIYSAGCLTKAINYKCTKWKQPTPLPCSLNCQSFLLPVLHLLGARLQAFTMPLWQASNEGSGCVTASKQPASPANPRAPCIGFRQQEGQSQQQLERHDRWFTDQQRRFMLQFSGNSSEFWVSRPSRRPQTPPTHSSHILKDHRGVQLSARASQRAAAHVGGVGGCQSVPRGRLHTHTLIPLTPCQEDPKDGGDICIWEN